MQDIFSSFLAPVLLDDVGCGQALLLGIGRRKKSELKTRDGKKGEGKKGWGGGGARTPATHTTLPWEPAHANRPLPSSKNPHFENEAKCTTFPVKRSCYLHEDEKSFPYQRLST